MCFAKSNIKKIWSEELKLYRSKNIYRNLIVLNKFSQNCSLLYEDVHCFRIAFTIFKHTLYATMLMCARSATSSQPLCIHHHQQKDRTSHLSVFWYRTYEWQWFLFWCTSRSSCDELCGRGEKTKFRIRSSGHLSGESRGSFWRGRQRSAKFVGSIAFNLITTLSCNHYLNYEKIVKKE